MIAFMVGLVFGVVVGLIFSSTRIGENVVNSIKELVASYVPPKAPKD